MENIERTRVPGGFCMEYGKTLLREVLPVKRIVTVHYFEFASDYIYEGEKHDFWEFLYVDKGVVEVMADTKGYKLKQGEMIFHKPNEFHNVWANGKVAPNIVVISFECKSPAMKFFENRIISIGDYEKNLLALIIKEAREAFSSPLDDSALDKLKRREDSLFGCEQLIKIYLEQLLISLVRKGSSLKTESRLSSVVKERSDEDMVKRIINYMNENISANLSFKDICKFSCMGGTNLKTLFKEKVGTSVMEYYRNQKIEAAKSMIREGRHNFTGIAEKLGYTSIHSFSRHFKKVTGMSPTEYALSVKAKI